MFLDLQISIWLQGNTDWLCHIRPAYSVHTTNFSVWANKLKLILNKEASMWYIDLESEDRAGCIISKVTFKHNLGIYFKIQSVFFLWQKHWKLTIRKMRNVVWHERIFTSYKYKWWLCNSAFTITTKSYTLLYTIYAHTHKIKWKTWNKTNGFRLVSSHT